MTPTQTHFFKNLISHKNRSPKSERTYSSRSQLPSHLLTITLTYKVKLRNQSVNTNYKGYYNKMKTLFLSNMIITNDVTSKDTTKDIVPWDSDRCYTFHSCRPQTVHQLVTCQFIRYGLWEGCILLPAKWTILTPKKET